MGGKIPMLIEGNVWVFGKNIDTDVILPGKYLVVTDPVELGKHAMEGLDPSFFKKVAKGDIVLAGRYFGCGSSREQAPVALKASGIAAVVAESYARIFYRNALNIGLPVLEIENTEQIAKEGGRIRIDVETGEIKNLDTGETFQAKPIPDFMLEIIREGGLIGKIKKHVIEGKLVNQ
jgi:3-isopropylmalate/(R)-2-methylmalate dehydratase small subunit